MIPKIDWSNETAVSHEVIKAKTDIAEGMRKDIQSEWSSLEENIIQQLEEIKTESKQFGSAIPEIEINDILNDCVSSETINRFKKRGAVVVRNVIPQGLIEEWYQGVKDYLQENDYYNQKIDPNLDTYFSSLQSQKPQIFNIFWSRCQVYIRQHENIAKTKSFLNSLWVSKRNQDQYFDPDQDTAYSDRIRIRAAGDKTLGLAPHIDGGSIERWLDNFNLKIYKEIFFGDWQNYSPYDGIYRNQVENISSPAVCRASRTYQGWVALTPQGPGDGTLQLVPMIKESTAYLLLRPFLNDVSDSILCGAIPTKAQSITPDWHQSLLEGLVSIPDMNLGDTVWWHSDLIHAVENEHNGKTESSVVYVGAAPLCERNQRFLELQKPCFLEGRSSPDFAPEDREVHYKHRATLEDLTPLGKKQMGF